MTEDPAQIAAKLTAEQKRAVIEAKLENWPGRTAIYMLRYSSAADALTLWRLKIAAEYTDIENWFSPLTDFGAHVRAHLLGESPHG